MNHIQTYKQYLLGQVHHNFVHHKIFFENFFVVFDESKKFNQFLKVCKACLVSHQYLNQFLTVFEMFLFLYNYQKNWVISKVAKVFYQSPYLFIKHYFYSSHLRIFITICAYLKHSLKLQLLFSLSYFRSFAHAQAVMYLAHSALFPFSVLVNGCGCLSYRTASKPRKARDVLLIEENGKLKRIKVFKKLSNNFFKE